MKIRNAVCYSFSLHNTGADAMGHLRLRAPLQQAGINIVYGVENGEILPERVSEGDVVIFQRHIPEKFDQYQKIVEIARCEGKPIIYELDDMLFALPENHPDRLTQYYAPSLLPMLQGLMEADLVTVSTQKLRDVLVNFNQNVVVLPNYLDDTLWHLKPPLQRNSSNEMLTIGYMGTESHRPDLDFITPALLDLLKRYPQKISFHFWGIQPSTEIISLPQVEWTPSQFFSSYQDFSALFQTQSADIFIAPLVDSLFNRCKSPLKFFEYSALGAPGVYSNLETYNGIVSHGKNGFLASTLDEWTDSLIQLIENDELRLQIAEAAQATIREKWLLSSNAFRWNDAFQNAFDTSSPNRKQNCPTVNTIKSINQQLFDSFNKSETSIQALTAQMTEKEQTIAALTTQVAEKEQSVQALNAIHASRAWWLIQLIRRARVRLFPPGSRVEKLLFIIFKLSSRLFLQPLRKIRAFLHKAIHIEYWQKSLMKAKNRLRPEIRFLKSVSKKVSIVIPNYNGQKYLGECVDSLHLIDFPHEQYEIIVVDNASSDNSREFILSTYPDVVLIQPEKNLGFAGGCNLGIKSSCGEYIVLLNNDTVVDTNWLKELVAVAENDEDVAIAGSKLLFKHNLHEIQNAGSYLTSMGDGGDLGFHQPDEGQFDTTRETLAVCGASMLIRRTLIEEIGALDEDFVAYYEDTDLCYRTKLYGKKIVFTSKSVVHHVHAGTSVEWSPFFTFSVFRNKLLMHLKNSPPGFLVKILWRYGLQVLSDSLIRHINRKVHIRVLASLAKKFPKFLIKRFYTRSIIKREKDSNILVRLKKVKPRVDASSVKKVCIYNAYLPTMGGGENLTAHTIAYVNSMFPGASVDILCHETEAFDYSRFSGKNFVQLLESAFDLPLKNTSIRYEKIILDGQSVVGKIRRLYKLSSITKEYDLFINNTFSSLMPARANVNIYTCMFPLKYEHYGNPLAGWLRRLLFNNFLMSYDLFLAISQYTQKWTDEYWKVNSYVLYPPVQPLEKSLKRNKDNIILNVGRFFVSGHNKKQDVMVKIFIEMCDQGLAGDWKFVLVGRKHEDETSKKYIQSLEEIAKGYPIEFRYDTSADELQSLLDRAKIYWHATGYGENPNANPESFEHFGLSTIEAAQHGAVPIVFNAGGQPEIVNHSKNGFLWTTTKELIDYTQLMMNRDSLWRDISAAALDSMKIFEEEQQLRWLTLFLDSYYKFE